MANKSRFALFVGNRGMFPPQLIAEARREIPALLESWGHEVLVLPEDATRYGAVETAEEGRVYARFLEEHRGAYDGVILSLPNFGDENGALAALQNAGVPILIQAYPDELDKMSPAQRRDAFCGKFSIMDLFVQAGIKFTTRKPHVVSPHDPEFAATIDYFDRVCRVTKGLSRMVVGAVGARTTAFKTVRVDEVALQSAGITVETLDLSEVFARVKDVSVDAPAFEAKKRQLASFASWDAVPDRAMDQLTRLAVVLDEIVAEYQLDALAIRCWNEMEQQLGVSPCVLLGLLNDTGIPAACEVDVAGAIAMYALSLASGQAATLLDWNNNYGQENDKCILFHCGPVPASLMEGKGRVTDHAILANAIGEGKSYGPNQGRIKPTDMTYAGLLTQSGRLRFYLGEGRFTDDPIPDDFFGCAGVAEIPGLQDILLHLGRTGYRHHVSVTPGHVMDAIAEALGSYLGHDVDLFHCGQAS